MVLSVDSCMLCCAVLCCAVLCCAVLCCAVLCCAVLCCVPTMWCLSQDPRILGSSAFCCHIWCICCSKQTASCLHAKGLSGLQHLNWFHLRMAAFSLLHAPAWPHLYLVGIIVSVFAVSAVAVSAKCIVSIAAASLKAAIRATATRLSLTAQCQGVYQHACSTLQMPKQWSAMQIRRHCYHLTSVLKLEPI